jgi:hypothetical protein
MRMRFWAVLLVGAAMALPRSAHASQPTDTCDHTISALPATVNAAGTWCVTVDLATSITTGNAISIVANNAIVDCLDHVIDGSGGGAAATSNGIIANEAVNATVRNCHVRGFFVGMSLEGTGQTAEDNLVEHVLYGGIAVSGDMATIRRNRVAEVGGASTTHTAYGINLFGSGAITDNDIAGVDQTAGGPGNNTGLEVTGSSGVAVTGNRIRGIGVGDSGSYGITTSGTALQRVSIDGNEIVGEGGAGYGISCGAVAARARNNTISGFAGGIQTCGNSAGNVVHP